MINLQSIRYQKLTFLVGHLPFFCFSNWARPFCGAHKKNGSLKWGSCSVRLSHICAEVVTRNCLVT
jgi:hypothetical protein